MHAFYDDVRADDVLGPVFDDVAEVDWGLHLPKLTAYWCRVLLGLPGYDGAILEPHRGVHCLEPLRAEMFDRWYGLFVGAVDRRWAGPVADAAKDHAARIADVLARRVADIEWAPTERTGGGRAVGSLAPRRRTGSCNG